jgi:hypothetical protein
MNVSINLVVPELERTSGDTFRRLGNECAGMQLVDI